jgi:uroporphyrinogen decarboxylase
MAWAANYVGHDYRELAVTGAFNLDQISAISDPWRETSAYGVEFEYPADGIGRPKDTLIKTYDDISQIKLLDIESSERMKQRVESVRKMAAEVGQTHSVLGWIEGPLAEYADLRGLENALMDLIDKPEMFTDAADTLVQNAVSFAVAQIEGGADMIGIGDAAASLIGADLYTKYVLPLEQKLIAAIHEAGAAVKLHICGNIKNIVQYIAQSGTEIIDVDWMVPLEKARQLVGPEVTLCGNFDPSAVLLQGSAEDVAEAAKKCLEAGGERFILMPGCEVPPATPEENIRAFCPCEGCLIRRELRL